MASPSVYIALLCLVAFASCQSVTYYVSPFGSDSNSGTSPQSPFRTISKGVSASRGATLVLLSGVYSGAGNSQISISYSTTIQAQGGVFLSCAQTTSGYAFSIPYTSSPINIDISGFTITDCPIGIYGTTSSSVRPNIHLQKMVFSSLDTAIQLYYANLTLDSTTIQSSRTGISSPSTASSSNYITVRTSTFKNITGNAIYAKTCVSPLRVVASTFTRCFDSNIYAQCDVSVANSTFSNSKSVNGSSIRANASTTVQVTNSTFSYNTASYAGGAIATDKNVALALSRCRFVANSGVYGGAVSTRGTMNIAGSYFGSNKASVAGGGFYCLNGQNYVGTSTFVGNSAPTGAAYACQGCTTYTSSLNVTGSTSCRNAELTPEEFLLTPLYIKDVAKEN